MTACFSTRSRRRTELGGTPSDFPGKPYARLETYRAIIADPKAAPPVADKAYALYRAVRCYAPAGNNACGGAWRCTQRACGLVPPAEAGLSRVPLGQGPDLLLVGGPSGLAAGRCGSPGRSSLR